MRVLAGIGGAILIALMLSEFFVAFLLPRRVKRDPRIARGLIKLLWRPWRALARRLSSPSADTLLGFFGPLALLSELLVWTIGLLIGFAFVEWAATGGSLGNRLLFSGGLFLSAEGVSGSTVVHLIGLLEAATAIGVLFIVIGYMPAVYGAFSRREVAVSQLATRAGSPPAAGVLIHRSVGHARWTELERDLRGWEEWAADLMETHLSYPLLGFYRSQHVNQNWLAALTAMVDVAAFVSSIKHEDEAEPAHITYAIGRHALADLAHQYGVRARPTDRLPDAEFDELYDLADEALDDPVDRERARKRLTNLRRAYEPNAQALADFLALDLPPWLSPDRDAQPSVARPGVGVGGDGRDLVG